MRARRLAALAAGALLWLFMTSIPPAAAIDVRSWIVTLDDGVDPVAQSPILAAAAGGTVQHVYATVLGGFAFAGTPLQASTLDGLPGVQSVVPDGEVQLDDTSSAGQLVPTGVQRISGPSAHALGSTGDGVTVAVIDSGIDLLHPDLSANLHPSLAANCIEPLLPPQDDNSHGTHVAGTIAAADNGVGVLGVAPSATLVPVKAFDAAGDSTWAKVICGIDYVASRGAEIDVANMSFGDLSTEATACDGVTTSDIDALRQAVCDLSGVGVIPVAAAGNNMIDVSGFVPAAFPEAIAVSALSDTDGQPGGLGGCIVFGAICDDGFASLFSNYGLRVDVMAPGFEILSTMPSGAYGVKDGTSMAAPHVAGVVALLLEAEPALTTQLARSIVQHSGECPDGSVAGADAGCVGQGAWPLDPDTEAEPLVHALRAAEMAADGLHVGDLDATKHVSKKWWSAKVTVTIHGEHEALVGGAVVSFAWSGAAAGIGTCTTSVAGTCVVASSTLSADAPSATLTITGVNQPGQAYASGLNHDPDGSSDGTAITVARL